MCKCNRVYKNEAYGNLPTSVSILMAIYQVNPGQLVLLQLKMMEGVMTTGAMRRAQLQSGIQCVRLVLEVTVKFRGPQWCNACI